MPRGAGLVYDYKYLKLCVRDILEHELESGDEFNNRTLALLLHPYMGLSKKDKKKIFTTPLTSLYKSGPYFICVANNVNKEEKLFTRHKRKEEVKLLCGTIITGQYYYRKI